VRRYVEDLAFVIDGTRQIHPLAGAGNDHLIQVPRRVLWRSSFERAGSPMECAPKVRFATGSMIVAVMLAALILAIEVVNETQFNKWWRYAARTSILIGPLGAPVDKLIDVRVTGSIDVGDRSAPDDAPLM
jgi:hypothetical protein